MHIRQLSVADAEAYWALRLESLKQSPESFLMTIEEELKLENPIQKYAETMQIINRFTYGAFVNDELVGVVTLQLETPSKIRHKANILAMFVSQKHRGLKIGKSLMLHLIDNAILLKLEQLHLTVVSNNIAAKNLYTTLGFTRYGLEEKALKLNGKYWDEEHMVLFLK